MAPRPVLVLQHVEWERAAIVGEILDQESIPWSSRILVDSSEPDSMPSLDSLGGIIVMGGPMGALDFVEFPGIGLESELVRLAFDAEVPLFGICLGHQVIATALGARLHSRAASEVGIGEVEIVTDDGVFGEVGSRQPVLHWHHDVVEVPDGAKVLAKTAQTPNQAFRIGNSVFATQFHLEVDRPMLDTWLAVPEMASDLDPATRATIEGDFDAAAASMRQLATRASVDFAAAVRERD
ncbi:MAG TPA: type 1 glutamine amidotransferase [Galbitalea sp.]